MTVTSRMDMTAPLKGAVVMSPLVARPCTVTVSPGSPVILHVVAKAVVDPTASESTRGGVGPESNVAVAVPVVLTNGAMGVTPANDDVPLLLVKTCSHTEPPEMVSNEGTTVVAVKVPTLTSNDFLGAELTSEFLAVAEKLAKPTEVAR